jgi:putative NADH-flavin reductase
VVRNIAIAGAGGRMGKALIEALAVTDGVQLTAAIEHSASQYVGRDAGELAGIGRNNITVVSSLLDVVGAFDILIDFSVSASTANNAQICHLISRLARLITNIKLMHHQVLHCHSVILWQMLWVVILKRSPFMGGRVCLVLVTLKRLAFLQ